MSFELSESDRTSFVVPFLHESEHTKLITLLIINSSLAVFCWQLLPWEGLNNFRGDPYSSSSGHFTLCPPRSGQSLSTAFGLTTLSQTHACAIQLLVHVQRDLV